MIRKIIFLALSTCMISPAFASFKQEVKVNLNVENKQSYIYFTAHFESSDVFDAGQTSKDLRNGSDSIQHTYKHGPKNLYLSLTAHSGDVKFVTDGSCPFFRKHFKDRYIVRLSTGETKLRTGQAHEHFSFNVKQLSTPNPFHYQVSCSRESF